MTEDIERTAAWLRSMYGKSRFDLKYLNSALLLSDNWILQPDVYDDYLLIYHVNGADMNEERQICMVPIENINNVDAVQLAREIYKHHTDDINQPKD